MDIILKSSWGPSVSSSRGLKRRRFTLFKSSLFVGLIVIHSMEELSDRVNFEGLMNESSL